MNARTHIDPGVSRNWDGLQFRAILAVTFPAYLAVAAGARLQPTHWRNRAPHRSIFSEAFEAAGNTARMAFAG
jgi:hypothetical protein